MDYPQQLLKSLYRKMQTIRLCEERFVEPINERKIIGPVHLYTGEEAVAAGVCANLGKKDMIFGTHRSHGHYLAKGGDLPKLVCEVFCRENGCSKGRGGSMHVIDPEQGMIGAAPIVGGTISLALGAALASSVRKDQAVTVSFFGDGASGEGVLWEAVNFAAVKKLPIIFVCENNLYSTHMAIDEIRASRDIYQTAQSYGVAAEKIDGNNVLEVYETVKRATELCRNGNGPFFLEALTYRMRGHVGPDDNVQGTHTDIRPASEIEEWREKDPIKRLEKLLLANNEEQELRKITAEVTAEIDRAFAAAYSSLRPAGEEELLKYVFK